MLSTSTNAPAGRRQDRRAGALRSSRTRGPPCSRRGQWWLAARARVRCGEEAHQPAAARPGGMGREVRCPVRDGELDPGQHEALPEVPDAHREEPGLQPHVLLPQCKYEFTLDVHGLTGFEREAPARPEHVATPKRAPRRWRLREYRRAVDAFRSTLDHDHQADVSASIHSRSIVTRVNEDDQSDTAKAKRELDRPSNRYCRYHGHDQAGLDEVRRRRS